MQSLQPKITHRGSGRTDFNRYECDGHLTVDHCELLQKELGFPAVPYATFDVQHHTVNGREYTTWKSYASAE